VGRLQSNHEEADTKIILDAVDASEDDVTELLIHSPDTDVLVLAIRRHPEMYPDISFVTASGKSRRTIKLKPTVEELGPAKTAQQELIILEALREKEKRLVGKNSLIRMSLVLELYPIWVHKRSQTKKL